MSVPDRLHTLSAIDPPPIPAPALTEDVEWLAGLSPAIVQLRSQIERVAPYFRTALLIGEGGCGETSVARLLHQLSPLGDRRFVELPPAEADLRLGSQGLGFQRTPLFIHAEGTLYLPQPERLSKRSQLALVRLLREHGPRAPRIVAFSHRGLRSLVSSGGFSVELADSLGALRIAIPPLRERCEDIPELLSRTIDVLSAHRRWRAPQLAPDLLNTALGFSWPGNLIQLRAAAAALLDQAESMERSEGPPPQNAVLRAGHLQAALGAVAHPPRRERPNVRMARLDDVIHEHICSVLLACNGNKLRTAEALGISRSTLYRMLESQRAQRPGSSSDQEFQWQDNAADSQFRSAAF